MAKRVGGFFTKMGGEGGPKCKIATHPLPPDAEQRRRPRGVGGGQSGRSGLGGGRGPRKEGEGVVGNRSPASPRAMVACSSGATGAGGGGRKWLRRRRCSLGGRAGAGECGCGDGRGARGLFYSRAKAVEVGGGSARLAGGSNGGRPC